MEKWEEGYYITAMAGSMSGSSNTKRRRSRQCPAYRTKKSAAAVPMSVDTKVATTATNNDVRIARTKPSF